MSVNHSARPGGINGDISMVFFKMKVCCVFSFQSPYNKYTQYTIFNKKKKKITQNYPKSASMGFFLGTQE